MAFGFGFSKQKVLSAAEKFVQQGKLHRRSKRVIKPMRHISGLTFTHT